MSVAFLPLAVRRSVLCFCTVVGVLGGTDAPAHAQPSPAEDASSAQYGWVSGGAGVGRTGIGMSLSAGLPLTSHLFVGGRFIRTEELVFSSSPVPTTWDVGPTVGFVEQGRYGQLALASGIVIVGGKRQGAPKPPAPSSNLGGCIVFCSTAFESRRFHTVGIPVDVQAFFTPVPYLGIGLHGFAAVSPEENLLGASVHLQVRFPQ